MTPSCCLAQGSQAAPRLRWDGCPASLTLWFGHIPEDPGPCFLEEDALGPWLGQSHRDKAIACVCRFLPAWGVQNVAGGFERSCLRERPPFLLCLPSLGKR